MVPGERGGGKMAYRSAHGAIGPSSDGLPKSIFEELKCADNPRNRLDYRSIAVGRANGGLKSAAEAAFVISLDLAAVFSALSSA